MSKAREILQVIAKRNAAGEDITLAHDWGLGSGTLIFQDGSHTHFGADIEDEERKAIDDYINGLHGLLVLGHGLSVVPADPPPPPEMTPQQVIEARDTKTAMLQGVIRAMTETANEQSRIRVEDHAAIQNLRHALKVCHADATNGIKASTTPGADLQSYLLSIQITAANAIA